MDNVHTDSTVVKVQSDIVYIDNAGVQYIEYFYEEDKIKGVLCAEPDCFVCNMLKGKGRKTDGKNSES